MSRYGGAVVQECFRALALIVAAQGVLFFIAFCVHHGAPYSRLLSHDLLRDKRSPSGVGFTSWSAARASSTRPDFEALTALSESR